MRRLPTSLVRSSPAQIDKLLKVQLLTQISATDAASGAATQEMLEQCLLKRSHNLELALRDVRAIISQTTSLAETLNGPPAECMQRVLLAMHLTDYDATEAHKLLHNANDPGWAERAVDLHRRGCCVPIRSGSHSVAAISADAASTAVAAATAGGGLGSDVARAAAATTNAVLARSSRHRLVSVSDDPKGHAGVKRMGAMLHAINYTSLILATELTSRRQYMLPQLDSDGDASEVSRWVYDPRFLVFEFLLGFMLRARQFELTTDFVNAATDGRSLVNQMIMGQGKTTVIAPMLALLLADGKRLVSIVCPAPLLEMSRSVTRQCFANVIHKRVYTFAFERSDEECNRLEGVQARYEKLRRARDEKAVVCTNPESVKSFMLKYIDNLHMVEAAPKILLVPQGKLKGRSGKLRSSASELANRDLIADEMAKLLKLWRADDHGGGGIALLDEVDLLLHPLKSELNFPVGEKHELDGAPGRWDFAMHLLDSIFEQSWSGSPSSPDVSVSDLAGEKLRLVGEIFREGATQAHQFAMQATPHYVLLRKEYYTQKGFREGTKEGRQSLIRLMGAWAMEWLKIQPTFMADVDALLTSESEDRQRPSAKEHDLRKFALVYKRANELHRKLQKAKTVTKSAVKTLEKQMVAAAYASGFEATAKDNVNERIWESIMASAWEIVGNAPKPEDFGNALRAAVRRECEKALMHWVAMFITDHVSTPEKSSDAHNLSKPVMRAVFGEASLQLVNLAKDWLVSFLPHALSKINRVHYGLVHDEDIERWKQMEAAAQGVTPDDSEFSIGLSRLLLAVPFSGKDVPSRNSEFAHPEVLIGLTILAYRYEGLRKRDLVTTIKSLKQRVAAEKGPFEERPTAILFKKWISGARATVSKELEMTEGARCEDAADEKRRVQKEDELRRSLERCKTLADRPLDKMELSEPSTISLLHYVLAKSADVILYYLRSHVFPRVMQHQPFKLQASGVDLGSDMLFGTRLGFSGTPSNLLPMELRPCIFEPGSEAQVVRVATDAHVMTVLEVNDWSVTKLIDVVRNASPGYHALIDTGALVTGFTNQEVCEAMLRDRGMPHVDVAIFLNARDEKVG